MTQLARYNPIQRRGRVWSFTGEEKTIDEAANNVVLLRRKRVEFTLACNCYPQATWQLSTLNKAVRNSFYKS